MEKHRLIPPFYPYIHRHFYFGGQLVGEVSSGKRLAEISGQRKFSEMGFFFEDSSSYEKSLTISTMLAF
jgi:hypothetical protein